MDIVLTLAGVALIAAGLRDMFHSLLHPQGQGRLSRWVLVGTWKASRATGHRLGSVAGPAGMVAVILMWVLLQTIGWALVYLPHLPSGFSYSGVDPERQVRLVEAVYVSLTTLSTVGFGDVVATDAWIRLAAPIQALTGFALLTAALTWFTQVYPPLSRRRSLALALHGMRRGGYAETLAGAGPGALGALDDLSARLEQSGIDFAQHTESYFFLESDPELALAEQLPYAVEMRDRARASTGSSGGDGKPGAAEGPAEGSTERPAEGPAEGLAARADRLSVALDRLAAVLAEGFVSGEGPEEVFAAYAADHRRPR